MDHTATVQQLYEAFGQGDIPAILDRLADDVVWEFGAGEGYGVPWMEPQKGPQGAARFFEALGLLEITHFEPVGMLANGHQVAVPIEWEVTVRATGRTVRDHEVHLWTFNDAGRVTAFRCLGDTHRNVQAYEGSAR
jgi:uncharacterized protein